MADGMQTTNDHMSRQAAVGEGTVANRTGGRHSQIPLGSPASRPPLQGREGSMPAVSPGAGSLRAAGAAERRRGKARTPGDAPLAARALRGLLLGRRDVRYWRTGCKSCAYWRATVWGMLRTGNWITDGHAGV